MTERAILGPRVLRFLALTVSYALVLLLAFQIFDTLGPAIAFALLGLGSAVFGGAGRLSKMPRLAILLIVLIMTLAFISELNRVLVLDYIGGPPPRSLQILQESLSGADVALALLFAVVALAG